MVIPNPGLQKKTFRAQPITDRFDIMAGTDRADRTGVSVQSSAVLVSSGGRLATCYCRTQAMMNCWWDGLVGAGWCLGMAGQVGRTDGIVANAGDDLHPLNVPVIPRWTGSLIPLAKHIPPVLQTLGLLEGGATAEPAAPVAAGFPFVGEATTLEEC